MFRTPHMSGYLMDLMEPIRDNEDFINLRKMHLKLPFPLKITLLAVLDVHRKSFEVLIVSDCFDKLPRHVKSTEQLESLP